MSLTPISSENAPKAVGPYSQAMRVGNMVFTSGQIALDPKTGVMTGETVAEQAELVLSNLRALLEAAGSGMDKVIKTTVFLTDMDNFAGMNAVYEKHFGDHRPARSTIAVRALPKNAIVEIEAVAIIE
jgi:2-iminobutanoate/2-iminopropanoate deaminase